MASMVTQSAPLAGRDRSVLLVRLERVLAEGPKALARAAQYIIENPEKVLHQSLAETSEFAEVGQASIIRLCRDLGHPGFGDLKIALSADIALRRTRDGDLARVHPLQPSTAEVLQQSISDTNALIDEAALARVVEKLARAKRIDLFGLGMSGLVSEMMAYRFLRLGYPANATRDPVLAHEVSIGLGKTSAVIALSQSGATPETVRFLKTGREAGAFTLAITGYSRSALAQFADEVMLMGRLPASSYGGSLMSVPQAVMAAEALADRLPERID